MISLDGYKEMPLKAKAGCERACASKRDFPGRSVWKGYNAGRD